MGDKDVVTKAEFYEWSHRLRESLEADQRNFQVREPHREEPAEDPLPEPEVDTSVKDADSHDVPDFIHGLPQVEDEYRESSWSPRKRPELDPGVNIDPDLNIAMEDIPTGLGPGYGVKGRERDSEEVERELGDSYGG